MAVEEHRRDFHEQLNDLITDVIRLSGMSTEAIASGTQALLDADLAAVERVFERDDAIDELTHGIEERCYLLLARQQPMASDLRTIVSILRDIHELERIGDLMKNIAKGARRIYPRALDPKVRGLIERMGQQAAEQLRTAIDAFADADPAKAAALEDMDDRMDEYQKELFRAIFSAGAEGEDELHQAVQVALIGRYYERIADHAVNIAQRVVFMVTGAIPGLERPVQGPEAV